MTTTLADTKTTILFPGDNSRSRSRNASAVEERRYRGYDGAFTSREKKFFFNTANVIYWQLVKYCSISLVFLFSVWAIPWKYGKEDDAEVYKGSEWVKLCLTRWTDQAYERDSGYIRHRVLIMELPIKRKGGRAIVFMRIFFSRITFVY